MNTTRTPTMYHGARSVAGRLRLRERDELGRRRPLRLAGRLVRPVDAERMAGLAAIVIVLEPLVDAFGLDELAFVQARHAGDRCCVRTARHHSTRWARYVVRRRSSRKTRNASSRTFAMSSSSWASS